MTGWIKIETSLPEKPEVIALAILLGLEEDDVVGKLVRLWRWCDAQLVDKLARHVPVVFIDRLIGCPAFSRALIQVGWLVVHSDALEFPHFERHLAQGAKKRALDAERKRAARSQSTPALPAPAPQPQPQPQPQRTTALAIPPDPSEFVFQLVSTTWTMSQTEVARLTAAYPGLDVAASLRKCRDWMVDNKPRRSASLQGVQRRIATWLRKDQDDRGGRLPRQGTLLPAVDLTLTDD